MKTIKVSISQNIDIPIGDNLSNDDLFDIVDKYIKREVRLGNINFAIDSVDGNRNHFLVDEMVG